MTYLQVDRRTIYRWVDTGQLPALRVGRLWRFRRSDVDARLEERRRPGRAAPPPPTPRRHGRVVVVAPADLARRRVVEALVSTGEVVDVADTAAAADALLSTGQVALLVADLPTPDLDTFGVIRRARQGTHALPVLIVTTRSTETDAIAALHLGVSAYLTVVDGPTIAATAMRLTLRPATP